MGRGCCPGRSAVPEYVCIYVCSSSIYYIYIVKQIVDT